MSDNLSFQPAYDVFHACFRILRLKAGLLDKLGRIDYETLRALDFYLLFPFRISEMKMTRDLARLRSKLKDFDSYIPYGILPDSSILFDEMQIYQDVAINKLASIGCVRIERNTLYMLEPDVLPALKSRIEALNQDSSNLFDVLTQLVTTLPSRGINSLRSRSGLVDTRYDIEQPL